MKTFARVNWYTARGKFFYRQSPHRATRKLSLTSTGFLLRMKKFSALIIIKRMNLWQRIFSISSAWGGRQGAVVLRVDVAPEKRLNDFDRRTSKSQTWATIPLDLHCTSLNTICWTLWTWVNFLGMHIVVIIIIIFLINQDFGADQGVKKQQQITDRNQPNLFKRIVYLLSSPRQLLAGDWD